MATQFAFFVLYFKLFLFIFCILILFFLVYFKKVFCKVIGFFLQNCNILNLVFNSFVYIL